MTLERGIPWALREEFEPGLFRRPATVIDVGFEVRRRSPWEPGA